MNKLLICVLLLLLHTSLPGQVDYTARDLVMPYDGGFRPGINSGTYPGFTDEMLADLAAGNPAVGNPGVGAKALRPALFDSFTAVEGVASRVSTFQHYFDLDLRDNTVIVGFPADEHRDTAFYCPDIQSEMFAGMYEPIWDDGTDGTPYNEENYYAAYLWEVVQTYQDYVKFWEIWNEPGFDYTSNTGFLPPGAPDNWWENNPDPCDYKLRAPIFHYVRLLRISWEVIKSVDPDAYVVVSGTGYPSFLDAVLRNTDNPADGTVTTDYPLGGGAYFDVMGFHSYPHFDGSLREYSDELQDFINYRHSDAAAEGFNRTRADYQEVLDNYGYDGSTYPEKLWTITECNLPRVQFGDYIGSTEAQRNFMTKAYVECAARDFVQLDIYKIAEDETDATAYDEFDLMGLYYQLSAEDGYFNEANEAGLALQTATRLLFNKDYNADRTAALNLPETVKGGAFADAYGNYTYVLWAKTTTDMSETASATYSFPADLTSADLIKRTWDYGSTQNTEIIPASDIALDGTPIFLTEQVFNASNLTGCVPLDVQFTDLSESGAVSWEWEIFDGDAVILSDEQNPNFTFYAPGGNLVLMRAFDATGNVVAEQIQEITVIVPTAPVFTADISGPIVHFTNESDINTNGFHWDFGDGNTSTEITPQHVYYASGTYTVTLTTENICGTETYSETLTVNAPSVYLTEYSADDQVPEYTSDFRAGYNFGYYPQWTDQQVADIAAGNANTDTKGIGAKSVRTFLGEFFVNFWGYDVHSDNFNHYANLGINDAVMALDFPSEESRDANEYCPGHRSNLFKNLYHEIWDDGANDTPINEENPYAVYVYNMVQTYGDRVKFWEIVNAPDFELNESLGYLPPGQPGNWWDNNPEPCDIQLRAPIFHYIRTLRISYEIIKYLQPDAYVAISGIGFPSFLDAVLRNTDNPADGSVAPGYERGGGAYFDAVGIKSFPHFDGATSYFDTEIGDFAYNRHSDAAADGIPLAKNRFAEVLENYGYGTTLPAKEWLIAEANVPRYSFDDFLGGEVVQRNWMIKAYVEAVKNDIRQFHIFDLAERTYGGDATTSFDVLGLYQRLDETAPGDQVVNDEGIALRTTSQLLYGRAYDAAQTAALNLPPSVGGAAFRAQNGDYTYVLWAKTDTDNSEANTATYTFPAAWGLTDLYQRNWDFGETETVSTVSAAAVELTAAPIFLNEDATVLSAPVATFTADTLSGCAGLEVQFINNSAGEELSYLWEFAGGTPSTSTEVNPIVVFAEGGNFTVSLTVTNAVGAHTAEEQNYISVEGAPTADFSVSIDGENVSFSNNSVGSYFYAWDFGDDQISGLSDPEYTYTENGEYLVTLIAFNDCTSDTLTQLLTINAAPNAAFSYYAQGSCETASLTVTDQTTNNAETWLWEFAGGNPATYEGQFPPQINYADGGTYPVTLTVTNANGTTELTQAVYIPGNVAQNVQETVCDNESVEIAGVTFDSENTGGTIVLQTVAGCDSLIHVSIDLLPTYEVNLTEVVNVGESITVGTSVYTATGEYSNLLTAANGCDSLVNLDLTVLTHTKEAVTPLTAFTVAPNPVHDMLTVQFDLFTAAEVSLTLTDIHGRTVHHIAIPDRLNSGQHTYIVKPANPMSGVYFCRLRVGDVVRVLRVVWV